MKKIIMMVLCLVIAVMPAMAEGYSKITIEEVENLTEELGFDGANGEEVVIPLEEGYYLLWRDACPAMYVYVPNDGWHAVEGSRIDEGWAETQLLIHYERNGLDPKQVYKKIEEFGSAGNAYISICSPDIAIKGDGFIAINTFAIDYAEGKLPYIENNMVIDLEDFSVYTLKKEGLFVYVGNDGKLFSFNDFQNGGRLVLLDAACNEIEHINFSALGTEQVQYFFNKKDGMVVVYTKDGNIYASWLDKDGNIEKTNFICGGSNWPSAYYFEEADALVVNRGYQYLSSDTAICVISKFDGTTKAVFYDSEICDYAMINTSDIEFSEKGKFFEDDNYRYIMGDVIPLNDDGTEMLLMTCYKSAEESKRIYELISIDLETLEIENKQQLDRETYSIMLDYNGRSGDYTYNNSGLYRIVIE